MEASHAAAKVIPTKPKTEAPIKTEEYTGGPQVSTNNLLMLQEQWVGKQVKEEKRITDLAEKMYRQNTIDRKEWRGVKR